MSILDQQIKMSEAMTSGRTIEGQTSDDWVSKNVTTSQLRSSDRDSDLISGFFPGVEGIRPPSMYPDNRSVILGENIVNSSGGTESIRDSRTAAQLG